MRSSEFLDTLGVNTHIGAEPYNDPATLASDLAYLGIANIRQSSPTDAAALAHVQQLGNAGVKVDLIVNGNGPVDLTAAMGTIRQLAPVLNAVEGVNEPNIWPIQYKGRGGIDAAADLQKDLYASVKADPVLARTPVYMFALGGVNPDKFPSLGDLSAYADYANVHAYPPQGVRPLFAIPAGIQGGRTDAPSKPVVLTETGYYTLPQDTNWGGVPEAVQASYTLDLLLDEAAAGTARTYLYDLIDDGADPRNREHHFGLFRNDGTAKPAAAALHNLTTLLADAGADSRTFKEDGFTFTAAGVPYNYTGNTMLFQKSDGTHVVAVWNEEQTWNPGTQTATPPEHHAVTVDLKKSYDAVQVFDPTVGPNPVQTLHGVSQVSLDLTDHPLLIEVPPAAKAGIDTLKLSLSEDAYLGDAQAVITVDGKTIGGTVTVTALHGQNKTQTVALSGQWGAGAHDIGVQFTNDAWGGTPATDRNLYVNGIALDGQASAAPPAALYSNGTAHLRTAASTLVLQLSEDAYLGDAQFTVAVDGKTLGPAQAVTTPHAGGAAQNFAFGPAMAAGTHDVAVSFLNDAYGGTPATDRNLYVDAVSVNGAAMAGTAATLFSASARHFSVVVGDHA